MRFWLKGKILLSAECRNEAKKDAEKTLQEANQVLLKKGVPTGQEGAKILKNVFEKNALVLEIQGTTYVRPHEALKRLKKPLAETLGKKHRIGLRGEQVTEYKISFELDKPVEKEFKIPFAKLGFSGKKCEMTLTELGEDFLQKNYIDRMISLVKEKAKAQEYAGKTEHWELMYEGKKRKHFSELDPSKEIEKKKWSKRASAQGVWIHGPITAKIMRTMEQIVYDELLKPLGFSEMIFPKIVTWDVWKRSGHAKSIYPEIYYICPPQTRDPEYWEEITDHYKITQQVPAEKLKQKIKDPIGGVTYAQCPPFWPYLEHATLEEKQLPMKVFDRSGTSMRYESGGLQGIERVNEFHRIEILWLGYPDQVADTHQKIIQKYHHIFENILELEYRRAWVTPWFLAQEGKKDLAEESGQHKVGTVDFEAWLPYRGTREDSEWLEFQNASNNGPKYPAGFNVKSQKNKELYSGCSGVGLERWTVSFLAQKGLDPKNWPGEFKKRVGKLPEETSFL